MKPRGRSTARARARMRAFYFVGANGQETARSECSWNWIKSILYSRAGHGFANASET